MIGHKVIYVAQLQSLVGGGGVSKMSVFLYSVSALMVPISRSVQYSTAEYGTVQHSTVQYSTVLIVPIFSYQPAAVSLYWATSGLMGILINLALLHPPVR